MSSIPLPESLTVADSTSMEVDQSAMSTPDRARRDKKLHQRELDPTSTPSKKRCETNVSGDALDCEMNDVQDPSDQPNMDTSNTNDTPSAKGTIK